MASGFTLAGFHLAAFHLATIAQRKMELNADCSPDLSNDRRQNDVALAPSIGQLLPCDLVELTGIEPVTSCLQSRRSPN